MGSVAPRVVVVTRHSDYSELLAVHATRGQAAFYLSARGQCIDELEHAHRRLEQATASVTRAIPSDWRSATVQRSDLDRFLFEPRDIVVAVGQDGLVANLAKYLHGQPVIGLNPMPDRFEGVLVRHPPDAAADLIRDTLSQRVALEARTLVQATVDDGQVLVALNEIFIGHCSHQSARYRLRIGDTEERQSSSGVIVTTGTGASGWARSIHRGCKSSVELPRPVEPSLAFFVREAYPSISTGTSNVEGRIEPGHAIEIVSEMNRGGVIFGDGIEADRIEFTWGSSVRAACARDRLNLVTA